MKISKLQGGGNNRSKLLLAVALGVFAFAGVWYTVESNNQTDEYLVSSVALPAGSPVSAEKVSVIRVNLGGSAAQYLKKDELPPGSYLLGPIAPGQLITKTMLASAVLDSRAPVVINSKMPLSSDIKPGSSVDLWVSNRLENNTFAPPHGLVFGAEVSNVTEPSGMFADASPSVELWVPIDAVAPILSAIASEDALSLVMRQTYADAK